ncbi:hypothetical protein BH11BAC2_BH11BAC2_09350 [soil metagenome]
MKNKIIKLILLLNFIAIQSFSQYVPDGSKIVATDWIDLTGDGVLQGSRTFLSPDGSTLLFSSPYDSLEYGACWIYTRDSSGWNYQAKLVPDSVDGAAQILGIGMNAAGNRIAIGGGANNFGVGAIWIFELQNNIWVRTQKITVQDTIGNSRLGQSIAMSPDGINLIAGGPEDNNLIGAVWTFEFNGTAYVQTQKIIPNDNIGIANFGISVNISKDGNRIAVGGPYDNSFIGAAWIFDKDTAGVWQQTGNKLVANDYLDSPFLGQAISLAPQGDVLAIGGHNNDVTSNNGIGPKGGSWIFSFNGTNWSQTTPRLLGTGYVPLTSVSQGISLALSYSGDTLVVGGDNDENGEGSVWIFIRNGNNWIQSGNKINPVDEDNGSFGAHFASSLSMDYSGENIAIGGASDADYIGATWVYKISTLQNIQGNTKANQNEIVFYNNSILAFKNLNNATRIEIFDVTGRLNYSQKIELKTLALDIHPKITTGLFLVVVRSENGDVLSYGKFIKL